MSFGIAMNKKSRVQVCTPQLMAQALDSPQTARACATIADALEACRRGELTREEFEAVKREQKDGLQCFCFHATFRNGRRISAEAVPSGLCIYDIDHIPHPQGWWEAIEPRREELGIVMAHITPSGEGCRLVFYTPRGMSLPQAQAWMAQQVGDKEYDTTVSDLSRCSFAVPREYVLFLDEEGLFSVIQSEAKNLGNTKVGENVDAPEILPPYGRLDDKNDAPDDKNSKEYPSTYEGIPYGNIVQVLEEQMGGEPEHGSRNNFIFAMACHLRHVCNDDPEWIAQLLPTYGEGREKWMATLRSACARVQTKQVPRIMQRTLHICKMQAEGYAERGTGQVPPPLPRKLPPLIKLLVGPQPDIYKPAVCHAVFPALAAHLKGVYFCYIDNILHEATLSCVLAADTGAGKNCVNAPIDRILADIRRRDAENLRREKEWKTEMNTKGANKDKRARPEGLVIQEVDADMTNAAFVQRMAEADGHFLYTKMNEIDQFDALKTSARSKAHFQIMCLAFDPGNTYGQTRVGTASISERVCIRFNWNRAETEGVLQERADRRTHQPHQLLHHTETRNRRRDAGLRQLRRGICREAAPVHRTAEGSQGDGEVPAGGEAGTKDGGGMCRICTAVAKQGVREPELPRMCHRLPEGHGAVRGERLPMGQEHRGVCAMVAAVRPVVQDELLRRGHRGAGGGGRQKREPGATELAGLAARRVHPRGGGHHDAKDAREKRRGGHHLQLETKGLHRTLWREHAADAHRHATICQDGAVPEGAPEQRRTINNLNS